MTDLAGLREVLTGEVIEPGAPGYEAARRPAMARFGHIRPRAVVRDLKRSLAGLGSAEPAQPEPPEPVISKSEFFRRSIPASAITELLDAFIRDRAAGQHRELNFTPMGGAYNRVPADATAFVHREERFLLEHVTVHPGGPATGSDVVAQWVQRSWAGVHLWGSGRVYPNFPDPDLTNWTEAYYGSNRARLARVETHLRPGAPAALPPVDLSRTNPAGCAGWQPTPTDARFTTDRSTSNSTERRPPMARIVLYMSMSLDGFITGPSDGMEHPLGRNGYRLHDWLSDGGVDPESRRPSSEPSGKVFDEMLATGAVIAGRRTFDLARGWVATTTTGCRCSLSPTPRPRASHQATSDSSPTASSPASRRPRRPPVTGT